MPIWKAPSLVTDPVQLVTVQARFLRPHDAVGLSGDDLDRLADALIEAEDVVTVRVDSTGTAVYRVDADPAVGDPASAATRPLDAVKRTLGLDAAVESIHAETGSDVSV